MLNIFKKSLLYIVTGSCSIVFAACYGPPARLENPKLINVKNPGNEAIQGLKVTLYENKVSIKEQFTNESGSVEFNFAQKDKSTYTALIEDVDGPINGAYKSKNIDLTNDSFIGTTLEDAE